MIIKYIMESFIILIVISILILAPNVRADSATSIALDVGRRTDDVSFNIAGFILDKYVNILSELSWTGLQIIQQKISVDHRSDKLVLLASVSTGSITSGSNQDSDYFGDNRTLEFSRSYNETSGDDVVDFEIGLGYQFDSYDKRSKNIAHIIPMAGYSYHEQNLRMTNGNQVLQLSPSLILQPFSGLNTTYQTEWDGLWAGVQFWSRRMGGQDKFTFIFKRHFPDYYAEANWNLRDDFKHPKSFEHQASGTGNEFSVEWAENTTEVWALKMTLNFQKWQTNPGVDTVYFSDGAVGRTRLNAVEWKSTVFTVGIERRI